MDMICPAHYSKIFWTIIVFYPIYMVDNFFRMQIPADFILSYQDMLGNIPILRGSWMVRHVDMSISLSGYYSSSSPIRIFWTELSPFFNSRSRTCSAFPS